MKISIIIPVYNASNTINYCVNSILCQHVLPYEIILVDDHSSDNSLEICHSLSVQNKFIKVYQSEGKGVSAARNTGLKYASGDIIGFCDADDLYEANMLSCITDAYTSNPELDIVVCGYFTSQWNGKPTVQEVKKFGRTEFCTGTKLLEYVCLDESILGSVWNKFYKASLIDSISFNVQLSYCEDMYFNAEAIKHNPECKCRIINEALYHYIQNQTSATNSADRFFDQNQSFKYSVTLNRIADMYDGYYLQDYFLYRKAVIALDTIRHYTLAEQETAILLRDISESRQSFFKIIFRIRNMVVMKYLAKYMLVKLQIK